MSRSLQQWFRQNGWTPFPFQESVWDAVGAGDSGLLHATTGAGKTLAVWGGILDAADADDAGTHKVAPLSVLWITPMRALAADTLRALSAPMAALRPDWTIGLRTGDTPSAERARQDRRLPTVLVTTPESVSLLLSRANAQSLLRHVHTVVVDEWHEMLGNKRGVQVQLALARLARWRTPGGGDAQADSAGDIAIGATPALRIWGLSATLGNLDAARDVLLHAIPAARRRIVQGHTPKVITIDTLIPHPIERFPWAGHLGTRLVEPVAREIDGARSALLFTNTRAQSELWYQALLAARPDWAGVIALHHGSLDASVRRWVEEGLREGTLKAVVCTSSLDLGVDFSPVERVFQVGSPKGVARLLQRAGRSGHAPGRPSRVTLVPTHALELIEAVAARNAALSGHIESRTPPEKPLDVLVQHLVTLALGGGFDAGGPLLHELQQAWSYRNLDRATLDWTIAFVEHGGDALRGYPTYHRIARGDDGHYHAPRADLARRHRANIGTIVADAAMRIEWVSGGRIGTIEESFVSRLRPGDTFTFAGRTVTLVRIKEMTAYVRRADSARGAIPQWQGGRMPLSSELADAMLDVLAAVGDRHPIPADASADAGDDADRDAPELRAVMPLLMLQRDWSALPRPDALLVETVKTREGWHHFCYPFAGRTAHIGLAALCAWRAAKRGPLTLSLSVNDYGFELLGPTRLDWDALIAEGLFAEAGLEQDILDSLNASELAARRFREIARISGLIFQSHPGEQRSARQLQASAGLFYQVFAKHEPDNRLLTQARDEVLLQELDVARLRQALQRINAGRIITTTPPRPTPFAFPLMIARLRERISTEQLHERVQRMLKTLERAADLRRPHA
ncbi:ligase-associated DNA damage response DEXH box helicase [Robbsia sp. KACC 23696]|uniref:ligase-associated DNA damage response DEXH box helicase n=1 Tax=Robbsia sp. KACC 23696 TaxID=3149231 RepID=UPI00325BF6CC